MAQPAASRPRPPFKSIVIATDFSAGATMAMQRAAHLPLAAGAKVTLLHVQPANLPARLSGSAIRYAADELTDSVSAFIAMAEAAGQANLVVSGKVANGSAAKEILRHAGLRKAELIIIGRHGRRLLDTLVIGTTAQSVTRSSAIPVLVVNSDAAAGYKSPLLATDLEPSTRRMAQAALRLLSRKTTKLALIHAWDIPFQGWLTLGDIEPELIPYLQSYRADAIKGLEATAKGLANLGLPVVQVLRRGDPRYMVVEEAKKRKADLIIVGSHGRSGVKRLILGTVAEAVVASASSDVLVVR